MNDPVKIERQAAEALRLLLEQVPAIRHLDVQQEEHSGAGYKADLVARLDASGDRHILVCEVKSNGQPRHVRPALLQLRDYVARQASDVVPVFIAPYLSAEAQALCREYDVGFIDLEGNARLAFGGIFIDRQVASRPVAERRELRSLFKPKSAQVLRLMLRQPQRAWRVAELAEAAGVRAADRNIDALASDGIYRTDHHLAIEQGRAKADRDPQEVVASHVRRLEALRRAGIVERVAKGLWKVPDDLPERGRQYDARRLGGGVVVELKSHLSIERQTRVIGATWLDQQLIGGSQGLGELGFGGEARQALHQRVDFLPDRGWPNGMGSASSWRATCWERCAIGNWLRPRRTLPPKPAWRIGPWRTDSA